jgi:WhiB family redox-sensing transcriptional regulator
MSDLSTIVAPVQTALRQPVTRTLLSFSEELIPVPSPVRPARRILDTADWTSLEDAVAAGVALPCHLVDPDLFFADSPREVERAKSLCADCPVRALCLDTAIARREPWGVWGGEWFAAGEAVGRKRPRGRPRKKRAGCAA